MAALAPLTATPARQPFGVLDGSHLRSLQSVKNRQNALIPSSAPSLKRRHASPEISDSENVDPNKLDSVSKRKRAAFGDDVSISKASRYSLTSVPSSKLSFSATPRLDTSSKLSSTTPASAPAAAGRSPTHGKRQGILPPRKKFAPPAFRIHSPSLSITAALKGTLAHKKAKKVRTIEESKPKSWFFDIFEETEEVQDYRINEWTMTQSATILDISDDESKSKENADRGKENIDPNEVSMPVTRSMAKSTVVKASRKDMMTDETRSPLGDLNPADYFAVGLDATSVVLVQDDVDEPENEAVVEEIVVVEDSAQKEDSLDFTFDTTAAMQSEEKLSTSEIGALLMASAPVWDTETLVGQDVATEVEAESFGIDIWESESAKDENEGMIDESIFALQEI